MNFGIFWFSPELVGVAAISFDELTSSCCQRALTAEVEREIQIEIKMYEITFNDRNNNKKISESVFKMSFLMESVEKSLRE